MTRDPEAHRPPPGWARTPSAFRMRGTSLFPAGRAGTPVARERDPAGAVSVLDRLEAPVRGVSILLVLAPLVEVLATAAGAGSADRWIALAAALPGALRIPATGVLALTVLSAARPGRVASALALGTAALGLGLAGTTSVALAAHLVAPGSGDATAWWATLHAAAVTAVFAALLWGGLRHAWRPRRGAAPPTPRPMGIDFLE